MTKIIAYVILLGAAIAGAALVYTNMLRVSIPVHYIQAKPGQTLEIQAAQYFSGYLSEVTLLQQESPTLPMVRNGHDLKLGIPPDARGIQVRLKLVASNLISSASSEILVTTDMIGQIRDAVSFNVTSCLLDEMGPYCWGAEEDIVRREPSHLRDAESFHRIGGNMCLKKNETMHCWGRRAKDIDLANLRLFSYGSAGYCKIADEILECTHGNPPNLKSAVNHIQEIAIGRMHSCLLGEFGIECWGDNRWGALDVPRDLIFPSNLDVNKDFSCVLDVGKARCWGKNSRFSAPNFPQNLVSIEIFRDRYLCAKTRDKTYCQPDHRLDSIVEIVDEDYSQLKFETYCKVSSAGLNCSSLRSAKRSSAIVPYTLDKPSQLKKNGGGSTCFLDEGRVHCFGKGQRVVEKLAKLGAGQTVSNYSISDDGAACVVLANGKVRCSTREHDTSAMDNPDEIISTRYQTCVLKNRAIVCVGDKSSSPPIVNNPVSLRSTGYFHGTTSCVLDEGSIRCWGNNEFAQTKPAELANIVDYDLTRDIGCAINYTEIKCWGNTKLLPRDIPNNFTHLEKISLGSRSLCVIDNGESRCAGLRGNEDKPEVARQPQEIASDPSDVCIINNNGVTCWGSNYMRFGMNPPQASSLQ